LSLRRCSVLHLSSLAGGKNDGSARPQDVRILGSICLNSALPDVQTLRKSFGLSQTEAEIALLITAGYSPRRIASKRGSSEETVRWHIKNIYSKTFTNRLVDLALQLAAARSPFITLENLPVRRELRQFSVSPAIAKAGAANASGLLREGRKPVVRMPA
jgi:DNA-binding CsgD family transcriptional regulator